MRAATWLCAAAWLLASAQAGHVALVGPGYAGYGPAELSRAVRTDWRFLREGEPHDPATLGSVDVVVELSNNTPAAFAAVPNAKWVLAMAAGDGRAQMVTNCHQSAVPIAEYLLANILELVVNVRAQDSALRRCTWKSVAPGNNCTTGTPQHRQITDGNLTVGVIGYGSIGQALAVRAAAVGLRVIGTTLHPPAHPPAPLAWLGSDSDNGRLMAESDFVVLACPLTEATRSMLNHSLLSQMKPTSWLLNIARGAIVDETALWRALQPPGQLLAGAVLDVWWNDIFELPPAGTGPSAWPSRYRFDMLPNVIMTGHSSSDTPLARKYSIECIADNLDRFSNGFPLRNVIRNASGPVLEPGADVVELAGPGELSKLAAGREIAFRVGEARTERFRLVPV